jgi:diphthamide biosynthesis methyltransferase
MFYAIGLGLADEKDVSVKGLEIIKRAERVYLEAYTAVLLVEKEVLVRISLDRILKTCTNRNRSRKLTMAAK